MIQPIDDFFSTNDFAEPAVLYVVPNGPPRDINVIYTDKYAPIAIGFMITQNKDITVYCRSSDVASATPRSVLVVRGLTLYVDTIQPDGTGVTILSLCTTPSTST